jgi:polar amino acid transport system substrate-binding protein
MKLFFAMITLSTLLISSEILKISYSRSSSEPYVLIDKRKLTGGVLKELMDALSKQSGLSMEYVLTAKRNQGKALQEGKIDGICLVNPEDKVSSEKYLWTVPLYTEEDVLIVRRDKANDLKSLESLFGYKVGAIEAHHHPKLDPYFKNNSIERIDNKKLSNNINQLRFGVIDAVVDTKLSVGHCMKKKNIDDKFVISNKVIDQQDLHCMFRKDMNIPIEKINTALQTLKEKGVIDKIISKYRASL